jgi:hypothetical protein
MEWGKQELVDQLQQAFPDHNFRVDSVCKHPTVSSKTALVTFISTVPEAFSALTDKPDRDIELEIGREELIFGHCLGLTTLFEPPEDVTTKAEYALPYSSFIMHPLIINSVLFVHGLSGHAIGSWTSSNGKCWPRDFLGNDLTGVRIISFGYEAKLILDTSTSQLSDFGQQLLGELFTLRETVEVCLEVYKDNRITCLTRP